MKNTTDGPGRRAFLKCCATAAAATCGFRSAAAANQTRPNIVFIFTDDQATWTVGALGAPDGHTPNLDKLFADGAVCRNAFVTTPVCSPSRVGLIASRYGTEVGITDWICPRPGKYTRDESQLGLDPATPTWVGALRDAGYATGLVGKWHLGTLDKFHPSHFGYDFFAGFREGGAKVKDPDLEIDGEIKTREGLTVDLLTDQALRFIREKQGAQPFALSLHYRSPHAPWLPVAEEDAAPYTDADIDIPNPDFPDLDTERVDKLMREYLSSVSGVDRNVGRVLALLDELNLTDNTVVIFSSDHGYNVGHHGLLHKGNAAWITNAMRDIPGGDPRSKRPNMFDTSLRVPVAVRWPGVIDAGTEVTRCVTNQDWFPTILAMAGIDDVPDGIRGHNFLPLLKKEDIPWDDEFYGEYNMHHYKEAKLRMWRTPEWKLVVNRSEPGGGELYDLVNDPGETTNLFSRSEHAHVAVQTALWTKLAAKMNEMNDPALDVKEEH